jgi:hypothetical protein
VGVAYFEPENPISIDELLSKADALMYAQKQERKRNISRLGVRNRQEDLSTREIRHGNLPKM